MPRPAADDDGGYNPRFKVRDGDVFGL